MTSRLTTLLTLLPLTICLVQPVHAQSTASSATPIPADQDIAHEGRWRRAIENDLISEKFDDLDRLAETYRRDKTRLPGGDWALHVFYSTLDSPQQTDKDTVEHLAHLRKWMELRPESITARVALATSLHRWAWVARGNGFANTVTPEGARLYHERSQEAQVILDGSRDMKTMCPQWYSQMLAVGVDEGWDVPRMREIFERGVQFEPGYQYFYEQFAYAILPKWYGQPGDAAKFAKTAADRLGGDTGDMMYFEIATNLIRRGDGNFPVHEMDWERIQRGFHGVVAQYGSSRRIQNEFAFMAYKYKDTDVARQQFAAIGDDWATGVWRDRQFFDRARDWASGHTSWP